MSCLVFGTGGRFGRLTSYESAKLVDFAINSGITWFDTGFSYCGFKSQPQLFNSLKSLSPSNQQINISTKFDVNISLPKLRQNIYQTFDDLPPNVTLHTLFLWGPSIHQLNDPNLVSFLSSIKSELGIKHLGVNSHDFHILSSIARSTTLFVPDSVMLDYNLCQLSRANLFSSLRNLSICIWAGTALCQGLLVESILQRFLRTRSISYFVRSFFNPSSKALLDSASLMRRYLYRNYPSRYQSIPLSFVSSNPYVDFVPVGMLSKSSIKQNLSHFNSSINPSEFNALVQWASFNVQI